MNTPHFDISSKVGLLYPRSDNVAWPMYSYSRPCDYFWNGFASGLLKRGCSEERIKDILQSKRTRWMFDAHGEELEALGKRMAKQVDISPID